MHIFEIYKKENASVVYNFQIKERELYLFSNTFRTDKWLSLENWSYIYKKLSGITKSYVENNKHESSVIHLPGDLKLTIKFEPINVDIKKLLSISNYKFEYYINILIDYVSDLKSIKKRHETKRNKHREYSPSFVNNENGNHIHYTPLPTTSKPNISESSTYKPAPCGKQPGKDEYIPESGSKESDSPDISYKPTKIEELSQTSTDRNTDAISSKRRRKYESLNEDFLGSQNRNQNQKVKDKKKSKLTELFSQSDSESTDIIQESPPADNLHKKENTKKLLESDSKQRSSSKRRKRTNDRSSNIGSYPGLADLPLPKNKFNCHKLTIPEIKDSFKEVKPKLDKCIDSYYDVKRRVKLYCEDPLIIHELFTEEQASFMYQQLQDQYLSANDTGANFADLFSQVLLPAWALHLSAQLHNVPEDTLSKLNV